MNATHSPAAEGGRRGIWWWSSLAVLSAVVFIYILVTTTLRRGPAGDEGPAIGLRLPYLKLEPLTGGAAPVSLDDLQGRVTLLNYWGTWCGPCRLELPHLVNLAEKLSGERDFRLVAVSCGQEDDSDLESLRTETEDFLQASMFHLPTYADQHAASRRALLIALGIKDFSYPTTLLFDQQGVIRGFWVGYSPQAVDEMGSLAQKLLHDEG